MYSNMCFRVIRLGFMVFKFFYLSACPVRENRTGKMGRPVKPCYSIRALHKHY